MNVTALGLKALKEIIDDHKPSALVLSSFKQEFNISKDDLVLLRKIINGSLKHFYLLRYQATTDFKEFNEDDDEIYLVIICLFEIRYCSKTIANFQAINDALDASDFLSLRFERKNLETKLNAIASIPFVFPESIRSDPYKFNSLFFSVPEWIIKMWANQYGDEICMSLLKDSLRSHNVFVRVNSLRTTKEELLSSNNYKECPENDNALIYVGADPISKTEDFLSGRVFIEDLSSQIALSNLYAVPGARAVQLHDVTASISSNVAIQIGENMGKIETSFDNEILYRRARYQYQRLGIENVKAYIGNKDILLTYCEFNKYDLVLSCPASSYLGQISKRPSILATITKKEVEDAIKGEKENLEFASKYLNDKGTLIYMVQTINKEEGEKVITDFLSRHKDYSLVESKQIFPFDYLSDGLYYARIVKVD